MQDVSSVGEGVGQCGVEEREYMELYIYSRYFWLSFFCKLKIVLKNKVYYF